ncbi:hypothetical protein ASG76_13555 [Nocardioides sp. Soil774]|nr:hypothetical protein ASG76_13555 [Nocardioides sp. Soil774]
MPSMQQPFPDDVRLRFWLRSTGIAAMVAAGLGSVLYATPAMPEPPSTDSTCRISVVGDQWTGHGCTDADAAR